MERRSRSKVVGIVARIVLEPIRRQQRGRQSSTVASSGSMTGMPFVADGVDPSALRALQAGALMDGLHRLVALGAHENLEQFGSNGHAVLLWWSPRTISKVAPLSAPGFCGTIDSMIAQMARPLPCWPRSRWPASSRPRRPRPARQAAPGRRRPPARRPRRPCRRSPRRTTSSCSAGTSREKATSTGRSRRTARRRSSTRSRRRSSPSWPGSTRGRTRSARRSTRPQAALAIDPANVSAHRILGIIYASMARHRPGHGPARRRGHGAMRPRPPSTSRRRGAAARSPNRAST